MMIGALAELGELPIAREDFMTVVSRTMPSDKVEANLAAFDRGTQMISTLLAGMDDTIGNYISLSTMTIFASRLARRTKSWISR